MVTFFLKTFRMGTQAVLHLTNPLFRCSCVFRCQTVPTMRPFSPRDFLASVHDAMPMLKAARGGDWLGLYGVYSREQARELRKGGGTE